VLHACLHWRDGSSRPVDPSQHGPALRARCLGGTRPGHHAQQPGRHNDSLDDHPGQVRQENLQVNGIRA
jgi:hypothetical protein